MGDMEVGIGGQARRGHGNRGLVSSPFLYPHHRGTQPVRQQVSRGLTVVCTHTHTPPKKMVSAPPFARVPPARPSPGPDEDAQCKSFSIRSTWVKTIRRQQYRLRPSPSSASLRFPVSARREVCKGHGGGNGPFGVARFEKLQVLRPAVADDLAATEAAHGDDPARARARVSESDPGGGGLSLARTSFCSGRSWEVNKRQGAGESGGRQEGSTAPNCRWFPTTHARALAR